MCVYVYVSVCHVYVSALVQKKNESHLFTLGVRKLIHKVTIFLNLFCACIYVHMGVYTICQYACM